MFLLASNKSNDFFTGGETMITVHQIQTDYQDGDAEENTSVVLGELDIGELFDSIRLNQKGDLLLVLIPEKTHALLFRLCYEDRGMLFLRLSQKIAEIAILNIYNI